MTETILVLNAGSSSIKFQLFAVVARDGLERRMRGQVEGIGTRPRLMAKGIKGETLVDETWPAREVSHVPIALEKLIAFLRERMGGKLPTAIGHRVVHGGPDYSEPTLVSEAIIARLERFAPLAPDAADRLETMLRDNRLSARGLQRVRRVALTLADLADESPPLRSAHLDTAVSLRTEPMATALRLAG